MMGNGWMGKIIRVNLTDGTIKAEPLNMQDAKLYAGGRGLGTKYYKNEVNPQADALSPENDLIFMTGPLTGTAAAGAGRYEVISKTPLTGAIGSYGSDGHFGAELKFAGYDGILFEGKAKKPVYLYLNDDHAELRDASHLWGKKITETETELAKETQEDVKVACIGPDGETLDLLSAIFDNKNQADEHPGFGAVMGSKNLKAIAVKGTQSITVAKQKEFLTACLKARSSAVANSTAKAERVYGDQISNLTAALDSLGIYPFTTFAIGLSEISEMFRACTGMDDLDEEILQIGKRTLELEKTFFAQEGSPMLEYSKSLF